MASTFRNFEMKKRNWSSRHLAFLSGLAFFCFPGCVSAQTVLNPSTDSQMIGFLKPALAEFDAAPVASSSTSTDSEPVLNLSYSLPIARPQDDFLILEVPASLAEPAPKENSAGPLKFHFWPAFGESMLFTGVMHTFNLATEPGTRDALNGPWFRNYTRSVSELRGWSDSDRFMAPYVGHTLEGSIFGFIERQNDSRARNVELGDGREYWASLLRSMAYSAVWHTQWKIGPISEASIGNVMLHASPGFITLVDTPTLGFCEMLAEDAADRWLIVGLENRTSNRVVIILARSFLNPARTFANIMAFRPPWDRGTRIGLFGENYEIRKEAVLDYKQGWGEKPFEYHKPWTDPIASPKAYPLEAPVELTAFPYYESFLGGGSCAGGGGSGAARLSPQVQAVAEVSGCLIMHMPAYNISGDSLFYGGGLRWTPLAAHRLSPYAQVMFGGRKVTTEIDDAALKKKLVEEWNDGDGTLGHAPTRSDWSRETASNGPALRVGGGLDWVVTRPFAWRLLNLEYTHTWIENVNVPPGVFNGQTVRPQNGFIISTQAVVRIGTW
jgi:hypothetical protein